MKVVQFWNGTYGLRKGLFFHRYFDFVSEGGPYWWGRRSVFFTDCQTTLEKAIGMKNRLCGKNKVVE